MLALRFAATAVLNYGFGVTLAWLLPRAEFGVVSLLQNVLLLAAAVLAASFPWAVARKVARSQSVRDDSTDATLRTALVGNVGLGALLATGFVTAQLTPVTLIPAASGLLVAAVAGTIITMSFNAVLVGTLHGTRRFDALGMVHFSEVAIKVAIGLALVGLLGLNAAGVALGFLVGAIAASYCGVRGLRDKLPGRGPLAGRETFILAVPLGIGTTSFGLLVTLDILMLSVLGRGHGVTSTVVATYQVATILARIPYFLASSLSEAVFPFIAQGRTRAEAHSWFVAAFRWVPLGFVPLQLVLLVVPSVVLGLFPPEYAEGAGLVRLITVGTLGLICVDMLVKALYAGGFAAAVARRLPVGVAVELAALVILVPQFGAAGAAVAFAAGSWVGTILLAAVYVSRHRPARVSARVTGSYAAAIGVLVAVLVVAGNAPKPIDLLVISAGLGSYAAVAVRLGLFTDTDTARAHAVLNRLLTVGRAK